MSGSQFPPDWNVSTPITRKQPFKTLYIIGRVLLLFLLIPLWLFRYTLLPRPRPSWTLKQCLVIRIVRFVMPLNAACSLSPLGFNKAREVPESELKETSFVWIPAVDDGLVKGVARDPLGKVNQMKVPGYVWPKGNGNIRDEGVVGLWIHGGGYMMGNGSEKFDETNVARQLFQNSPMKQILSVDYRLTPESSHPAQLLDGLSAYAYLVQTLGVNPNRIIIFGACSGGHLTLMLTHYLYEEKVLPMPRAIMLFSPWVDMVIDQEITFENAPERPNADIDLLASSPRANFLFLGDRPLSFLSTPYCTANRAPPGSYTNYPKTFLSLGDAEAFQRECQQLEGLMREDGVHVTVDVGKDAVHDFLGMTVVPSDEARRKVVERASRWIEELKI